jgi:hypothetical protein
MNRSLSNGYSGAKGFSLCVTAATCSKKKWRAALFIFSRVPLLAGPALALYRHDNDNAKVN